MATEHLGPPRVRFDGDGATTVVPFDFPLMEDDEVKVYDYDQSDPDPDNWTVTELVAGFTVNLDPDDEGGDVTFDDPTELDHVYIILRNSEDNQQLDIPLSEARLNVKAIERALDREALVSQELKLGVRQALKFGVESTQLDVDVEDPIADRVLIWSMTADKVVNSDLTWTGLLDAIDAGVAAAQAAAAAAAVSEANAASSAAQAQASEVAAQASAAAASASEGQAAVSAGNAAASEAAALASETAAALSAAAAAASEAAAAASAAAALNEVSLVEIINDGDQANHSASGRQYRPLVSSGGEVDLDDTPFGTNPVNFTAGAEITLVGTSDANAVVITPSDIQWGIIAPRGVIILRRGVMVTYVIDLVLERWIEKSRNT